MIKKLINPQSQRQAERPFQRSFTEFSGMLSGIPSSEIGQSYSAKNVNIIDRGPWFEVRPGSKRYTQAVRATYFTANTTSNQLATSKAHQFVTGEVVYVIGASLANPLVASTAYYVIRVDANTIKLATTYAFAIAGTAIDITTTGSGNQVVTYGTLFSREDHIQQGHLVWQFGTSVFVSDKAITDYSPVLNLSSVVPSGLSTMAPYDTDMILASGSGIFRIVLDDTNNSYYMYRINIPIPIILPTDVPETAALIYGYRYIYSLSRLTGTGNRTRLSTDTELVLETGTCQVPGQEKEYGEIYFGTPVGQTLSVNHIIGTLTVPAGVQEATHFSVYRTKNIGSNSGGTGSAGIGNRTDQMVWCDDIPVTKSFKVTVAANVATIVAGTIQFEYADVGNTLVDTAGNTAVIASYVSGSAVNLTVGHTFGATASCTFSGGRVCTASQAGVTVTISAPVAGVFVTGDKGRTIFWSDGTSSVISQYVSATVCTVAVTGTRTGLAFSMMPTAGNFTRYYNDTNGDDIKVVIGRITLQDRIESGSDLYIPRRFFEPIPNSDMVAIETGFATFATRDAAQYYYSQIGDKKFTMGFHLPVTQEKEIASKLRHLIKLPSLIILVCSDKMYNIPLNASNQVGRTEIGENVYRLPEPILVSESVGIIAWQSIAYKGSGMFFAMTNEPALRAFDGHRWSDQNYAIDSGGNDAVQKLYVNRFDLYAGVVSCYSQGGGLKLWGQRRV